MLFSTIKVLLEHKRQVIPKLERVELPEPFRGRPELNSKGLDTKKAQNVAAACPTAAISVEPFALDMGRCLFCGHCATELPQNIKFTTSWKVWSRTREGLIIRAEKSGQNLVEDENTLADHSMFRHAIKLRQVCAGGDGANEMELNAATNVNFDMGRFGIEFVASPRHADAVVVTGAVTKKMAEPLEATLAAVPQPRLLIAVGTDAISGGMFEHSEQIDRSFFDRHTPDLFVAGHPAHPLSFIGAVRDLISRPTQTKADQEHPKDH